MRYRHKKTGGYYTVLMYGMMQSSEAPNLDMKTIIVYKAEKDNTIWVRTYDEFHDGRFELITE